MRSLNFSLSDFMTHKLCSQLHFLLQVKTLKHDTTVLQGHYLKLAISTIKIQGTVHTLLPYDGKRVGYRKVVFLF